MTLSKPVLVMQDRQCEHLLEKYVRSYFFGLDVPLEITQHHIDQCNQAIQHYTDEYGYEEPSTYLDDRYSDLILDLVQLIELVQIRYTDWFEHWTRCGQYQFAFRILDRFGTFAMTFY